MGSDLRISANNIVELVHAHNKSARAQEEIALLRHDEERFRAWTLQAIADIDAIVTGHRDGGACARQSITKDLQLNFIAHSRASSVQVTVQTQAT